ncbi:hypothetical protein HY490_02500 [Candidatus Woesearchaeota archaeon]|nr:hypothetical protein [Candidatus Woesearchaeota archaeon]
MVDVSDALKDQEKRAQADVANLLDDLNGIEIKAGDLRVELKHFEGVRAGEISTVDKIHKMLNTLKDTIAQYHSTVNRILGVMSSLNTRKTAVSKESFVELNAQLRSQVPVDKALLNAATLDAEVVNLRAIVEGSFSIEARVKQDVGGLLKTIEQMRRDIHEV